MNEMQMLRAMRYCPSCASPLEAHPGADGTYSCFAHGDLRLYRQDGHYRIEWLPRPITHQLYGMENSYSYYDLFRVVAKVERDDAEPKWDRIQLAKIPVAKNGRGRHRLEYQLLGADRKIQRLTVPGYLRDKSIYRNDI